MYKNMITYQKIKKNMKILREAGEAHILLVGKMWNIDKNIKCWK